MKNINRIYISILFYVCYASMLHAQNIASAISKEDDNKKKSKELTEQEKIIQKLPDIIEKIEIDYTNTPVLFSNMLKPIKTEEYKLEPTRIDIIIDLYPLWQYLIRLPNETIVNPRGGIGFLWKKGVYFAIYSGYAMHKSRYEVKSLEYLKYSLNGPMLDVSVGYMYEYSESNLIGVIIRYGGSFYQGVAQTKQGNKSGTSAHWIKLLLDTKSNIFRYSNIMIGLEVGIKYLLNYKKFNDDIKQFLIPEYGLSSNNIGFSLTMYLQYSIPLFRRFMPIS